MKININLNKTLKDSITDNRTSVYVWKNLEQLKDFYSGVVDPQLINTIADKIVTGKQLINNRKYIKRAGVDSIFNESCLCNLVEMELLNSDAALDRFMQKPIQLSAKEQ